MLELIVLGIAGVGGHMKSRGWVRKKLRYTSAVERPGVGLAAGVVTTLVAAPLVALLPIVGAPTAIALGVGVGSGVELGARDAREGRVED